MTRFTGTLASRMTYTATGSVTNIAARLSDCAKGGDILIGEKTAGMVKGLWPSYDRGGDSVERLDEADSGVLPSSTVNQIDDVSVHSKPGCRSNIQKSGTE